MNLRKNLFTPLIICGLLIEISFLLFAVLENDRNISLYIATYFVTFILFFFAYFLLIKKSVVDSDEKSKQNLAVLIIVAGMIFRLTLIPTLYTTSDDVHRYLWEGKVIANTRNPFTAPPNDSTLNQLHDENFEKVTFKHISAIYPPLSQIVFTVSYLVAGNSVVFLKIIYLIFELVTLIFLFKLLITKGKNPNLVLLYAWLPLPILEYFNNAHLDVFGITFLVVFIYYFEKQKFNLASVALAFAFLSKLLALLVLPLVIKKLGIKKSIPFYGIFLFISVIFYLPFVVGNVEVFSGLFKYLSRWEFNGSVYNLIKVIFSSGQIARIVCAILLSLSVLIIAVRYKNFINGVFTVFLCVIIFSTTLYPWYLGWIAALNVLNPSYSIMSLFFTINFSNFTPLAEKWKEYPIVWVIQYIPFYSLLVYDLWRIKKTR